MDHLLAGAIVLLMLTHGAAMVMMGVSWLWILYAASIIMWGIILRKGFVQCVRKRETLLG